MRPTDDSRSWSGHVRRRQYSELIKSHDCVSRPARSCTVVGLGTFSGLLVLQPGGVLGVPGAAIYQSLASRSLARLARTRNAARKHSCPRMAAEQSPSRDPPFYLGTIW